MILKRWVIIIYIDFLKIFDGIDFGDKGYL
jgi:hypothetical protein